MENNSLHKTIVLLTVIVIFFSFIFYSIFYSTLLANSLYLMSMRTSYQNVIWGMRKMFYKPNREFPPFDPVYVLRPTQIRDQGDYVYEFVGKFVKMDLERNILTATGGGQVYNFRMNSDFAREIATIPENYPNPIQGSIYDPLSGNRIDQNTVVLVRWSDFQLTHQLRSKIKTNPSYVVNENSPSLFLFY